MTDIKFIGTTQVELVNSLDESNKISPTQVGENFIEFSFNTLSKDSSDFYHFVITGSNVQVSGTIDSVTTDYQFFNLFLGCSQITDASQLELTAPTMKFFCFGNMFKDCTNLINPPSVEATTIADWCYQGMFAGCNKMTSAPQLPATTLAPYCYYAMFYGCKALTSAPYLSASTLVDWCYNSMFYNCQSLTSISADFIDWNTSGNSTKNWVTGIAPNGMFFRTSKNLESKRGDDNIPEAWRINNYFGEPLTFTGLSSTNAVSLNKIGNPTIHNYKYRNNNSEWNDYSLGTVINFNQGQKVSFICWDQTFFSSEHSDSNYYQFNMSGLIEADGNVDSLMNFYLFAMNYKHYSLFANCTCLTKAPDLPDTNLAQYYYANMFANCTSLTAAPELPATTLAQRCYMSMFYNCTSLSTAPTVLPATELIWGCYSYMFQNCSSLTAAPELPASSLAQYCYRSMFKGCSNLSSINVAFTEWMNNNTVPPTPVTTEWVDGVAANGTFIKPASLSEAYGKHNIPQNWTVINK